MNAENMKLILLNIHELVLIVQKLKNIYVLLNLTELCYFNLNFESIHKEITIFGMNKILLNFILMQTFAIDSVGLNFQKFELNRSV